MSDTIKLMADGVISSYEEATTTALTQNDISVSIQQVITNDTFYLWIIVAVITTLFTSQAWRFYQEHYAKYFTNPVRVVVIEVAAFVADILMASAIIYYIWVKRHPPPGQAADWYAAIYGLWFAAEGLKYLWTLLFWEYGRESAGAIGSVLMGVITVIVHVTLFVCIGYRQVWASFVLILIASVIRLVALVYNGFFTYYVMKDSSTPALNGNEGYDLVSNRQMMTQRPVQPVNMQQRTTATAVSQQQQRFNTGSNNNNTLYPRNVPQNGAQRR